MGGRRTTASSGSLLLLALAACTPKVGGDTAELTGPVGNQRYPSGPSWTGENASYSAGVLSAGDLDGDGLDDLVVDTIYALDGGRPEYAGARVLAAPLTGGSLEESAYAVVGGYDNYGYENSEPEPAVIADTTGDGLADLVIGQDLFSSIPAGYVPEEDATLTGLVDLYEPCALAGHAGYCTAQGFWSPDGTSAFLEPELPNAVVPWETDRGLGLWTVDDGRLTEILLEEVSADPVDQSLLPQVAWNVGGGVMRLNRLAGDLTGDGLPGLLGTIEDDGYLDVFAGLGLEEADVEPVALLDVGAMDQGRTALAVGDFDGDGSQDLAIGSAPGDFLGSVFVFRGPLAGELTGADADCEIVVPPANLQRGGGFGRTLAAGDFDGDGRDDLAIGEPGYFGPQAWAQSGRTWISWGAELD